MLDQAKLAPAAVARWASERPDAIALQHTGGEAFTYGRLDHEARRWADGFSTTDIGPGTHVATFLGNRPAAHCTLLGLAWLGAVEVPLNSAHRGRMLRDALDRCDATHIVTDSAHLPRLAEVIDEVTLLRTVLLVDTEADERLRAPSWPSAVAAVGLASRLPERSVTDRPAPVATDIACIQFTSGTTGPSKPVICPWGLVYQMWSWVPDDALGVGDGVFNALPLFHNSGRSGFNYAMAVGARFVTRDKFSASEFWADVGSHDCRVAALVGPLTALLYSVEPRADDADNPLESVILGPMIPDMEGFERRFGVRVATCYGQTEIGAPVATGWDHGPWSNSGTRRTDYPAHEVRVVDPAGNDVATGRVGEMIVRTDEPGALTPGYHGMPEATAAAWRDGWFHTGDSFRCDEDGRFYFVDRTKDMIRRRGENISSFEVESFVGEHPAVRECAAFGVPATHGDEEVAAAVIVHDGTAFEPAELITFLSARMPTFMVPRYVEVHDELPRNATTGRVRKNELRRIGLGPHAFDREA